MRGEIVKIRNEKKKKKVFDKILNLWELDLFSRNLKEGE